MIPDIHIMMRLSGIRFGSRFRTERGQVKVDGSTSFKLGSTRSSRDRGWREVDHGSHDRWSVGNSDLDEMGDGQGSSGVIREYTRNEVDQLRVGGRSGLIRGGWWS